MFIITMDGFSTASAASNDTMKRLIDEFERTQDILREARDQISHGFEDLRYEREALTAENSVIDANGSKILRIKAGGEIISVTRDTLTQIKGTMLEALFCVR